MQIPPCKTLKQLLLQICINCVLLAQLFLKKGLDLVYVISVTFELSFNEKVSYTNLRKLYSELDKHHCPAKQGTDFSWLRYPFGSLCVGTQISFLIYIHVFVFCPSLFWLANISASMLFAIAGGIFFLIPHLSSIPA